LFLCCGGEFFAAFLKERLMIIVTGGAGFIGSAVVWQLNQLGREDILLVDHLGTGEKWNNLVALRFVDYLEKDDLFGQLSGDRVVTGPRDWRTGIDAVIHLGACSSTTEQDATYLVRNNFEYSKRLALFALERGARFIYASSAATYGDGSQGFADDVTRLHSLRPLNMYGYSKHLFDQWARAHGLLDRLVGLKYFNVFGPNEYHKGEMRSLVVKAYEQIVATGGLRLFRSHRNDFADGEQQRDFLYVKDAVAMTLHFLHNREAHGIFNVGSGEAASWNRLAAAIFRALGTPVQIEYIDMPETIRDKYQYFTRADIATLRGAGYDRPLTRLEAAVEDYVVNYLVPRKRLGQE
jgi:ADP-L-glycero-D-manno-heptose 6-epimerase